MEKTTQKREVSQFTVKEEITMPKLIQVIESEIKRGSGTSGDEIRKVKQYHSIEGQLLAEHDPILDRFHDSQSRRK